MRKFWQTSRRFRPRASIPSPSLRRPQPKAGRPMNRYGFMEAKLCSSLRRRRGSFEKGVMVIPVYLAKGVEFDAVLSMMLRPKLTAGTTNASFFIRRVRGPCTGFIFTRRAIGRRSCRHCLRICTRKRHIDGSGVTSAAISCCS